MGKLLHRKIKINHKSVQAMRPEEIEEGIQLGLHLKETKAHTTKLVE